MWGINRLRGRNANGTLKIDDTHARYLSMKAAVEGLTEQLDTGVSNPEELQKYIDAIDEANANYDA